jgi:two-component system response regulator MtrA
MNKLKVLVVDDDPTLSSLVYLFLTRVGGFAALEENRSSAALATARAYRPHVVILDVDMPGKDGGDVATELRDDAFLKDVPIIFLSSLVTSTEVGVRDGAFYLAKPVEARILIKTVWTALGKSDSEDRLGCPQSKGNVAVVA